MGVLNRECYDAYVSPLATMTVDRTKCIMIALEEANKAPIAQGAFSVGCVLTHQNEILSTGYSRELEGNTHAEANAIAKVQDKSILSQVELYTTLEPCTVRTSGLRACTDTIIEYGIKKVFIGVEEPPDFVNCQGVSKLKAAGVDVIFLSSEEYTRQTGRNLSEDCLIAARRS